MDDITRSVALGAAPSGYEPTGRTRCPIDGARVESETIDGFHICSQCHELLKDSELVVRKTRKTRREYLAVYYPGGYDK